MKTIIKFYVLATLGALLITASCSSDDEPTQESGQCQRIEYKLEYDMSYTKIHSYPVYGVPSTNGQKIPISGTNKSYEVKCY